MNKTRNSLSPQVRREAIAALNQTVIELFDLFAYIKQVYWNMGGTNHLKLDELAGRIMGHMDHAAERAAALRVLAPGAFRHGVTLPHSTSKNEASPVFNGFSNWIKELTDLYGRVSQHVRQTVEKLLEMQDFASADLLADILRTLNLHLWLLETHLSQEQLKPQGTPCFTHSLSS